MWPEQRPDRYARADDDGRLAGARPQYIELDDMARAVRQRQEGSIKARRAFEVLAARSGNLFPAQKCRPPAPKSARAFELVA